MTEETRYPAVASPSLTPGKLQAQVRALALDYGGYLLSGLFGLIAASIYVLSPIVTRPAYDDSYISLTFARNLAEHLKLSYDGHDWSTGATSPLHVFLLAVPLKLGFSAVQASIGVGVLSHILLAMSTYFLAWALFRDRRIALLAGFTIAFTSFAAMDAGNGLETGLFSSLVALSTGSYFLWHDTPRGRLLTGGLLALTVLTRPEGALLIPAVVIYHWLEREGKVSFLDFVKEAACLAGPAVSIIGLEALYSLYLNGNIAGTASAKYAFFQEYKYPFREKVQIASDAVAIFLASLLPLVVLALPMARRRELLLFALFWVPVLVMYTLLFPGGLTHYFYRYQHPIMPILAAFAAAGAFSLVRYALANSIVMRVIVVAGLLVACVTMQQQFERWRLTYKQASAETYGDLELMAVDLNKIIAPNETLATHDIGAVGFFGDFRVLDLVGLVNPKVIPYHKDRQVKQYVEGARPDWLLVFPDWDAYFLQINAATDPNYELVKTYPGGPLRVTPYLLYKVKKDNF